MPATERSVKFLEEYKMLDLLKPMEPPMKRRAGLWIVQAGRGSYRGMFWKLKHQDEMVLAWEDGFCDILKPRDAVEAPTETPYFDTSNKTLSSNLTSSLINGTPVEHLVGLAIAEMSSTSHVLGKGIVGEAALIGNAHWIYSDSIATDLLSTILVPENPDEWLLQFAAGIKTILLLPVIPDGVLQLGSVEMVAEDAAFVASVKNNFDACKETGGCEERYSIEQYSLMSTFMNNLEEPSTFITEEVLEDQSSIHSVKIKDLNLLANQMLPVLMFQDLCNTSERPVTDTLDNVAESEVNRLPMGMIHVAEPCQSSPEDYEIDSFKYYHEENSWVSSHCDEFDSRICGEFMNGLIGFHFDEVITEPTSIDHNLDSAICENGSNFLSFPADYELHKTLVEDKAYTFGTSSPGRDVVCHSIGDRVPSCTSDEPRVESIGFPMEEVEVEHLLEAAVANVCSRFDDYSSEKSSVTSVNMSSGESFAFSKSHGQSKHSASVKEDKVAWNFMTSEFISPGLDTKSNLSASRSSVGSKISTLSDKQQQRKGHDSRRRLSRLSTTNKRRACIGDNQKPRPRDRQLIQDRIKELRDLVPNSEMCSIDGLLDKTIKHMLFLRNVTNQADKLNHPTLKEEADEKTTERAEVNSSHQNGTSWAIELGSEQQLCPIIVKDLNQPGHMLIEMLCTDHGRFLEIADVIHRLKLTILKGKMEKATDKSWARFIVETSGSFHRLDIFWPLMQLLQQSRAPISSKI